MFALHLAKHMGKLRLPLGFGIQIPRIHCVSQVTCVCAVRIRFLWVQESHRAQLAPGGLSS